MYSIVIPIPAMFSNISSFLYAQNYFRHADVICVFVPADGVGEKVLDICRYFTSTDTLQINLKD